MNYAQDRLDRRARHDDENGAGLLLLWKDYCKAFAEADHSLLAKTLRDVGWNKQALFHFAQAWMENPNCWESAADYCQMAELAGFCELGVVSVLVYRCRGKLKLTDCRIHTSNLMRMDHGTPSSRFTASWLEQREPSWDCGCGNPRCGTSPFFVPFETAGLNRVLELLETYFIGLSTNKEEGQLMQTANTILRHLAVAVTSNEPHPCASIATIPPALQFWIDHTVDCKQGLRHLPPVFQLLLIKLLYLTFPSLAAHAVVHVYARYEHMAEDLARDYKSHWAYYVLIRAVVLGERIKPSRRQTVPYYHVPIWDLLWQLDSRRDYFEVIKARCDRDQVNIDKLHQQESIHECMERLRRSILSVSLSGNPSPLFWRLPQPRTEDDEEAKPLYFVGDSHVLSLAWQHLHLAGRLRRAIPVVVTGLKAWHVRDETRFFTYTCLQTVLDRLLPGDNKSGSNHVGRTIVVSAGEIDCREGLGGPLLQGYAGANHGHHVERTVDEYVQALQQLLARIGIGQILVMPVPPHLHIKKGRVKGRAVRRETTRYWNQSLRTRLEMVDSVYFVDYEAALLDCNGNDYVLRPDFNADSTHMNAAFAPHFEQAVMGCGCDLNLL